MSHWQDFEALARKIQSDLAPAAVVTHNEKLLGKSGVEHQCDVLVRGSVGQYTFTCVIECKDHAEKVGLEIVRGVESRIRDLEAQRGVLVAASGFTDDALRYAQATGILTYTLVDAESEKWSELAVIPIVLVHVDVTAFEVHFFDRATGQPVNVVNDMNVSPGAVLSLIEISTGKVRTPSLAMTLMWEELVASRRLPQNGEVFTEKERYELLSPIRGRVPVETRFQFETVTKYHYKWLPLGKGRGFLDHTEKTLRTADDYEATLDLEEAIAAWPSTSDPTTIPLKPLETYWAIRQFSENRSTPRSIIFGRRRVMSPLS